MICDSKTTLLFLHYVITLSVLGCTAVPSTVQTASDTRSQGQAIFGNHDFAGLAGTHSVSMEIQPRYNSEKMTYLTSSNYDTAVASVHRVCSSPLSYTNANKFRDVTKRCVVRANRANCKGSSLTHVPQDLPRDIMRLDLSYNRISSLPDRIFQRYGLLQSLDLSQNQISSLCPQSFFGLIRLQKLYLNANNLLFQEERFPSDVFSPLRNLNMLKLLKNNPRPWLQGLNYPDTALSKLTKLSTLHLDGLTNPVFGPGFQNLTSLRYLIFNGYVGGYCKIVRLRNDTFRYLSTVVHLDLRDCFLSGNEIDPDAFTPLKQLSFLDLSHNEEISYEYLRNVFQGLRNAQHLKQLNLQLVSNRYSLGVCLSSDLIRDIPQSLTKLNVEENNLQAVDRSVIGMLPPGLEELNLSGNKFVFGTYLQDIHKLNSLKRVKINGASFTYNIPKVYPYNQPNDTKSVTRVYPHVKQCDLYESNALLTGTEFKLKFPKNLSYIQMMDFGLVYKLSKWTVDPDNFVESINISRNKFPELLGPIIGFNRLRELDISDCFVTIIYQSFFRYLTSLEWLKLGKNLIGLKMKYVENHVFSSLVNLQYLDLSKNLIVYFQRDAFTGLDNLEHLDLHDNPLTSFNVDLWHMKRLKTLRLDHTQLGRLPVALMRNVNVLLNANIHISINMSASPIMCNCNNLAFLEWMATSKAFDSRFQGYQCTHEDLSSQVLLHGYNETVRLLKGECTSHKLVLLIVIQLVVLFFLVFVCLICYQCRWKLRYMYYAAYLRFNKDRGTQSDSEFEYDVFICSADEDSSFVSDVMEPELLNRGLNLLVHERDFYAGEHITSNIVRAVQCSRKTLVLLTASMLKSKWCNFEIQMANMEALQTGRRVLLFFLKESRLELERTNNLNVIYNMKSNTYCEFPYMETDQHRMTIFWDKIARDLRA